MRGAPWIVLVGCARAAPPPPPPLVPAPAPRPALACPDGRAPHELVATTETIDVPHADCALYPCDPAPTETYYQLCGTTLPAVAAGGLALACRGADGGLDGPFLVGDGAGETRGTCAGGVLDGPWRTTAGSRVVMAGAYRAGKQDGVWHSTGPDGSSSVATYRAGELDGPSETLDARGRPMGRQSYAAGQLDGVETTWDAAGLASTATYDHGRLLAFDRQQRAVRTTCTTSAVGDEHCTIVDAYGVLRLEGTHAHDDEHGHWRAWYPTGELLGTTTSRGPIVQKWAETDGEQELFYRNGARLADTFCANGTMPRGRWIIWYPDGTIHFDDDRDHQDDPHSWRAYGPDGIASDAAQRCGDHAMSCQLRGSSAGCQALEMFTISVVPYDER